MANSNRVVRSRRFNVQQARELILADNHSDDEVELDDSTDFSDEGESGSGGGDGCDAEDAENEIPCVLIPRANDRERVDRDLVTQDNADSDYDDDVEGHIVPGPVEADHPIWTCPPMNWHLNRAGEHQPAPLPFTATPGIQVVVDNFKPIDFFQLFVTDDLFRHLVFQTNLYGDQYIASKGENLARYALGRDWRNEHTSVEEMKVFVGLLLLMGIIRKPTIAMYWSKDPLYDTPLFRNVMTRNRFQTLQKFWHFNDNENEPGRDAPDRDRLYKVRPIVDHLFELFQTVYVPDKQLAVDESLLLWKGRLLFRQYIPLKRSRFGIKLFCLCEKSGYTYRFRIYTGKDDPTNDMTLPEDITNAKKSEKVVLHMMLPLLDKGYHVFMDNWFSSAMLYMYLHHRSTLATGTVRVNQAPTAIREHRLHEPGQVVAYSAGPLLAQKYKVSSIYCSQAFSLTHNFTVH